MRRLGNALCVLALALSAGAASQLDRVRELQKEGKLEAARDLLLVAVEEYRTAGDSSDLAQALGLAADVSIALGRYDAAIQQAGQSVKTREALHANTGIGDDYNTMGLAYQYLGNYPAALDSYRKALGADRAANDAQGEVTRLNNIGNIFYFQGRYSDAQHSYDDAIEKLKTAGSAPWSAAGHQLTVANLAVLFQRLGQEQRALDYYRELADLRPLESPKAMPIRERAQLLLNQGVLYRRLGDPVKALELYRSAQALFNLDRHPDGEIGALRNIGIVRAMDLNDSSGALESFTHALELARRSSDQRGVVQASLYRGELLYKLHRTQEAKTDLEAALGGARSAGLVEEQWKSLHALGRIAEDGGSPEVAAQLYRDAVSIVESVRAGLKLVSLRSDFLADKRDVYDSMIGLRLRDPNATPAELFNWMERSRARTLLDRLRGRISLARPQMKAIQPWLAPGTVLVEYWVAADRAAAVWMTHTNSGLVRYENISGVGNRILTDIPLADRLIVVPDGPLSAVPFETLRVPGSDELLIEKCEVSYLPSARFIARPPRARWLAPWATEVIALADPPSTRGLFEEHSAPLPASAAEARAIARILPGRAEIHLGADMQKRYLATAAQRGAPLIHIAAHATIDAENPDRSRILFANDYLLQEEVYDLDLSGVDLVTLSACDTARGKLVGGEGVQTFSQAFLAAGAAAVVTTLWRVSDGPTADFMQQFYYALAHGKSKSAALRDAKLRFLHSHSALSDPRYWAAFVLAGDGSTPVPLAVSWSACLAGALVVVAVTLAGGVTAVRRQRRRA